MITQDYLKQILNYNADTGIFIRKVISTRNKIGDIAGGINSNKYIEIRVKGKKYKAHRLAWLYEFGEWPRGQIDHIDGDRSNNRIINLRTVNPRGNSQNREIHRNGHLVGTNWAAHANKWMARIKIDGKTKYLGYYDTQELAHDAYLLKLKELK